MEAIIYDRKQSDVDYAKAHPDSTEYLKGALNFTDLTRIERNCLEIQRKLDLLLGKKITINPVKPNGIWQMTDLIFMKDINQIRTNIEQIKNIINSTEQIEYTNSLDYKQLNILEKIIYEATVYIFEKTKEFQYVGTFYCGEEFVAY